MDLSRIWLILFSSIIFRLKVYQTVPIVGGRIVDSLSPNELKYPFAVSLQDVLPDNKFKHFCGASLISRRWILTAAHCLWRKNIQFVAALISFEDISQAKTEDYYRLERVEYRGFQPVSFQNDIALTRLHRDFVSIHGFYRPAKIPDYGMRPDRNVDCTIIGYGAVGHTGSISQHLLEANVKVITKQECRRKIGNLWAPKKHENTICALSENEDACQGDSGGPLLCRYGYQEYVYGLVSHGIACGGSGIPSVYTVTIPYIHWIRTIIMT